MSVKQGSLVLRSAQNCYLTSSSDHTTIYPLGHWYLILKIYKGVILCNMTQIMTLHELPDLGWTSVGPNLAKK